MTYYNSDEKCVGSMQTPFRFRVVWHDKRCCEFILQRAPLKIRRFAVFVLCLLPVFYVFEIYKQVSITIICLVILGCMWHTRRRSYIERESLLVIASLGLQFTTTFADGHQTSQFIEKRAMIDCTINEGISMHSVLYYLAVILKSSDNSCLHTGKFSPYPQNLDRIIPLFQVTLPRLDCLRKIYTTVNEVLGLDGKFIVLQ